MSASSTATTPQSPSRSLLAIYLINATLVIAHEIDSAYWREWELFHLPGGESGFVAVHLLLVPLILLGVVQSAQARASACVTSLVVGIGGLIGCAAHTTFLVLGDDRFAIPFSIGLIAAFGLSSLLLVIQATRTRRWHQSANI